MTIFLLISIPCVLYYSEIYNLGETMLSKLNIKNKLKIFSISLLVIFAGVIGFNYLNSITINNEANNIKNNSLPTTIASYKILGFTSQIETVSLKHVTKDINAISKNINGVLVSVTSIHGIM